MAERKFYWLKLKENFFRQKEIKKLRKIAGGDTYTIIYLKMQLLSLQNEGILKYEHTENDLAEQLSLEIDEDVDNIQITLQFLKANNLIEEIDEETYLLPKTAENIGKEGSSAERMRRLREKQKEQEQGLLENPKKEQEPYSNAKRQRMFRAKKNCEEKQHIPFIEDYMNKKRYNGNYYIVLQRDKFRCALCNSIENLCVHHIDGYDELKPENNNENKMVTLCRHCHSNVHAGTKINEDILNSIDYYTEYSNVTSPGDNDVQDCYTEKEIEKEINNNNIYSRVAHDNVSVDSEINNSKANNNSKTNSNNSSLYKEIIDYLNSKADTNYKHTTKKTQSLINARVKEGFTLEDFKAVIDIKTSTWKNTEMEKYLRPETLFGTKFESYLNEKEVKPKDNKKTEAPYQYDYFKFD